MVMPVYFFWPRKDIPEWLERIEPPAATVLHGGYGVVMRRKGVSHVYVFRGAFIRVDGDTGGMVIVGGGGGVVGYGSFIDWAKAVLGVGRLSYGVKVK